MSALPRWFEVERDAYRLAEWEREQARQLFGEDEDALHAYLSELGCDEDEIALNRRRTIASDGPDADGLRFATRGGEAVAAGGGRERHG